MSVQRVIALLGVGVVAPDTPILRGDDLGVLRGDGIFESIHVRAGQAWLLDRHVARLAHSAALVDLTLPPPEALVELAGVALKPWPAETEGRLRLVCTRGPEDGAGPATVFATVTPVSEAMRRARHDGIRVLTAALGFPAHARQRAPWLLGGAKTTSYALNMAAQRWAQASGADDVVWVSVDGYAMEAPTSTLVWLTQPAETGAAEADPVGANRAMLHTVPAEPTGILAGITARWLLDHADALGWGTAESMVTPAELTTCAGAWLMSSVRGIAAIRALDGTAVPFSTELTARVRELLGYE